MTYEIEANNLIKKILILLIISLTIQTAQAFEDYIITTEGKLTDISIEHNDIIDVYPLITIMNDKNTLIVHPLKIGKTRFCVLKNNKDKVMFNVNVNEEKTTVDEVEGFDILGIDIPPGLYEYELDTPPGVPAALGVQPALSTGEGVAVRNVSELQIRVGAGLV